MAKTYTVTITMEDGGVMKGELYPEIAPITVENFKKLCDEKFYDGLTFHRIIKGFMIQGGDPDGNGTGGPGYTIPAEIKLHHEKASVAMARLPDKINPAKNSNGSQFYACLKPMPKLDGQYTVFGEILEGLDVLDYISNQPTNSNDFPLPKIVIKSIVIEPRVAPPANQ